MQTQAEHFAGTVKHYFNNRDYSPFEVIEFVTTYYATFTVRIAKLHAAKWIVTSKMRDGSEFELNPFNLETL